MVVRIDRSCWIVWTGHERAGLARDRKPLL